MAVRFPRDSRSLRRSLFLIALAALALWTVFLFVDRSSGPNLPSFVDPDTALEDAIDVGDMDALRVRASQVGRTQLDLALILAVAQRKPEAAEILASSGADARDYDINLYLLALEGGELTSGAAAPTIEWLMSAGYDLCRPVSLGEGSAEGLSASSQIRSLASASGEPLDEFLAVLDECS